MAARAGYFTSLLFIKVLIVIGFFSLQFFCISRKISKNIYPKINSQVQKVFGKVVLLANDF